MMFPRILLLLALLGTTAVAADPKLALQDGERLTFRVGFGIFFHAGEIAISAKVETNDQVRQLAVTTTTATRGILHGLFPFEAKAEAVFDQANGYLQVYTETSASSKKKTNFSLEFDHTKSTALFTDFMNSANNTTVSFPPDNPMDLITSLVQTRTWDLKPGEQRDIEVFFEKEIYLLTVHALNYEEVQTSLGTFKTLVYEPRMEKTPPKGMFKRGSAVRVWISQDARHLPVKFEVEFKFGAGVATLVRYQPPGSAPDVGAETKE